MLRRALIFYLCIVMVSHSAWPCQQDALAPQSAFIATSQASSPTIRMISGQELEPSQAGFLERFMRYVARIPIHRAPAAATMNTPSGTLLVAGPGISHFWQKRWMSWMQDLSARLQESGITPRAITASREYLSGLPGIAPIKLEVQWDSQASGAGGTLQFDIRSAVPGGLILDTVLSAARVYEIVRTAASVKTVRFVKRPPLFDSRKSTTLYLQEKEASQPSSLLRTIHFYSELYRAGVLAEVPSIPADEALLYLLIFRARLFSGLSEEEQAQLMRELAKSQANLDHLTAQVIAMLCAEPNLLLQNYDSSSIRRTARRIFEYLGRVSHRPSLLRKESSKLAARMVTVFRDGDTSRFFRDVLRRCNALGARQSVFVAEAIAHARVTTLERTDMRLAKTRARSWMHAVFKKGRSRLAPLARRALLAMPDKALAALTEMGRVDTGTRSLALPARHEAKHRKGSKVALQIAAQNLPAETRANDYIAGMRTLGITAFVVVSFIEFVDIPFAASIGGVLLFTCLTVVADYKAQVFASRAAGKPINKLLVLVSLPTELFNAVFTRGAYAMLDHWLRLGSGLPLPDGIIKGIRFFATNAVSRFRGKVYVTVREASLYLQLEAMHVLEEAAAMRRYQNNPRQLAVALANIKMFYKQERKKAERRAETVERKYKVAWWLTRSVSIFKHYALANWIENTNLRMVLDSLQQPLFSLFYAWSSFRKGYLIPKGEAMRSGWYVMFYPLVALTRYARGDRGDALRKLIAATPNHHAQAASLFAELEDDDAEIRQEATMELGRLHHAPAIPILSWLAQNDSSESVRLAARAALGASGHPSTPMDLALMEQQPLSTAP